MPLRILFTLVLTCCCASCLLAQTDWEEEVWEEESFSTRLSQDNPFLFEWNFGNVMLGAAFGNTNRGFEYSFEFPSLYYTREKSPGGIKAAGMKFMYLSPADENDEGEPHFYLLNIEPYHKLFDNGSSQFSSFCSLHLLDWDISHNSLRLDRPLAELGLRYMFNYRTRYSGHYFTRIIECEAGIRVSPSYRAPYIQVGTDLLQLLEWASYIF
jgi:hypothetical protein